MISSLLDFTSFNLDCNCNSERIFDTLDESCIRKKREAAVNPANLKPVPAIVL